MTGSLLHQEQDIDNILEYAKQLDPTIAIFAIVTPIPGTGFYEEMVAQGLVEEHDWGRYDLAHAVLRSQHFTRQRLLDLLDECYRKFYRKKSWKNHPAT